MGLFWGLVVVVFFFFTLNSKGNPVVKRSSPGTWVQSKSFSNYMDSIKSKCHLLRFVSYLGKLQGSLSFVFLKLQLSSQNQLVTWSWFNFTLISNSEILFVFPQVNSISPVTLLRYDWPSYFGKYYNLFTIQPLKNKIPTWGVFLDANTSWKQTLTRLLSTKVCHQEYTT